MLKKDEIIAFLRANKVLLREKYGVVDIGLIGSYARDEQTEESDIDFLVKFTEPNFHFRAGLLIFLENRFNKQIDIVSIGKYLKRSFLEVVEEEVVYA